MIRYQNIYHMLAYAFQVLNEQGYRDVALEEDFENTAELLAAILCRGVAVQIKRGLMREYVAAEEPLSSPRGKILVSNSIKAMTVRKKQLVCTYDDFSTNAYNNRIIKTTFDVLMKTKISKERKKEIKKLLIYFDGVELLDVHNINWSQRYDRNNQSYQMLVSLCYMVLKGLLQTTTDGSTKLMDFFDEQRMCRLYEKFILEYYRRHYPQLKASASQIPWILDDGCSNAMLPVMQSDITLSSGNHILIIDAKYYSHATQVQYDRHTIHSNNLYQVFTYVKNKDAQFGDEPHKVSGLLLYAQTDEAILPNNTYWMSGNRIDVRTLNLDCNFSEITRQLNDIADELLSCQ